MPRNDADRHLQGPGGAKSSLGHAFGTALLAAFLPVLVIWTVATVRPIPAEVLGSRARDAAPITGLWLSGPANDDALGFFLVDAITDYVRAMFFTSLTCAGLLVGLAGYMANRTLRHGLAGAGFVLVLLVNLFHLPYLQAWHLLASTVIVALGSAYLVLRADGDRPPGEGRP